MTLITIQAHGQETRITGQVVRKRATDNGTRWSGHLEKIIARDA